MLGSCITSFHLYI